VHTRAAAGAKQAIVAGGMAGGGVGRGEQAQMRRRGMETGVERARDDHPVPAIVALAAEHDDPLCGERCESCGQKLHYPMPGILHQNDAGNPVHDRLAVYLPHLRSGQNFHMRRATSIVISSCNSPAPVHCTTASIVRAISSAESALEYLIISSLRCSSPNCSPYTFSGSTMPSVYATRRSPASRVTDFSS